MFKDMTDSALLDAIHSIRTLLWNASQMNDNRGVIRLTRQLDIAVAIKRQRGPHLRVNHNKTAGQSLLPTSNLPVGMRGRFPDSS